MKALICIGCWATLVVALQAAAEETDCPAMPLGVHKVTTATSTVYIAVAKAKPLMEDEGSFAIAEAEARLEARRGLIQYLSPGAKQMQFRGLIDASTCRAYGEVFATLQFDEGNTQKATKMQNLMRDSILRNPTR
ncbi:MAG: hypothetical protein IPN66_07160 [Candidatus Competibacteraceae bacterium]|nr:hypothetical protein [Candidatus Competibacteraceae bacterium]MBK8896995.1 hypothetical protein [Candidatus Competibacteraceae bacterium]